MSVTLVSKETAKTAPTLMSVARIPTIATKTRNVKIHRVPFPAHVTTALLETVKLVPRSNRAIVDLKTFLRTVQDNLNHDKGPLYKKNHYRPFIGFCSYLSKREKLNLQRKDFQAFLMAVSYQPVS